MQIHLDTPNPLAYLNEFANLSLQMPAIRKNPNAAIQNVQLRNVLMIIMCGVGISTAFVLTLVTKFHIFSVFMGMLAGLSVPYIKTTIALVKYKKDAKLDGNYDLDMFGIAHIKECIMVKVFWKGIKAVRVYTNLIAFIPEDTKITIMVAPIVYKEAMLEFMKQNGINIPVIDPVANTNVPQQPKV